jgi:diguanylate cyclase (GGDEF)-like protein
MARRNSGTDKTGRVILLVDDNAEYLEATRMILEREGHTLLTAPGGPEALEIIRSEPVELILLDFFMPGMTGEQVVSELRTFNHHVQVILQTGYASESPPRELLKRLDIQGYYDKSEGTEKLLLWTEVGLKAAYNTQLLLKSRQGLRYILEVTPELHKIQPLDDLLQGILCQVSGLLGSTHSFLAVIDPQALKDNGPEGFLAMIQEDSGLQIHAGVGRFENKIRVDDLLLPEQMKNLKQTIHDGNPIFDTQDTIVPLKVGETTLGAIYLDCGGIEAGDVDLLNIFANQASVAIHNTQLYSMATQDPLTGVFVRRFYEQWIQKEVRSAYRSGLCLSLIMVDLDNLKTWNDKGGHVSGDKALAAMGRVLRDSTRNTDFVGRYGGDEFVVILPGTNKEGADYVAGRIIALANSHTLSCEGGDDVLKCSLGVGTLEGRKAPEAGDTGPIEGGLFQQVYDRLFKLCDARLYQSKKEGRNRYTTGESIGWI